MSEPSLRDTVASALAKADGYAPSDNPEAWRDNRLRYEQMADAALRVIRADVYQMQGGHEWANGAPATVEGCGYNQAIEDVLARLGGGGGV